MSSGITTPKRIMIAIPTVTITLSIIVAGWFYLPDKYFITALISFLILGSIVFERIIAWEQGRKEEKKNAI